MTSPMAPKPKQAKPLGLHQPLGRNYGLRTAFLGNKGAIHHRGLGLQRLGILNLSTFYPNGWPEDAETAQSESQLNKQQPPVTPTSTASNIGQSATVTAPNTDHSKGQQPNRQTPSQSQNVGTSPSQTPPSSPAPHQASHQAQTTAKASTDQKNQGSNSFIQTKPQPSNPSLASNVQDSPSNPGIGSAPPQQHTASAEEPSHPPLQARPSHAGQTGQPTSIAPSEAEVNTRSSTETTPLSAPSIPESSQPTVTATQPPSAELPRASSTEISSAQAVEEQITVIPNPGATPTSKPTTHPASDVSDQLPDARTPSRTASPSQSISSSDTEQRLTSPHVPRSKSQPSDTHPTQSTTVSSLSSSAEQQRLPSAGTETLNNLSNQQDGSTPQEPSQSSPAVPPNDSSSSLKPPPIQLPIQLSTAVNSPQVSSRPRMQTGDKATQQPSNLPEKSSTSRTAEIPSTATEPLPNPKHSSHSQGETVNASETHSSIQPKADHSQPDRQSQPLASHQPTAPLQSTASVPQTEPPSSPQITPSPAAPKIQPNTAETSHRSNHQPGSSTTTHSPISTQPSSPAIAAPGQQATAPTDETPTPRRSSSNPPANIDHPRLSEPQATVTPESPTIDTDSPKAGLLGKAVDGLMRLISKQPSSTSQTDQPKPSNVSDGASTVGAISSHQDQIPNVNAHDTQPPKESTTSTRQTTTTESLDQPQALSSFPSPSQHQSINPSNAETIQRQMIPERAPIQPPALPPQAPSASQASQSLKPNSALDITPSISSESETVPSIASNNPLEALSPSQGTQSPAPESATPRQQSEEISVQALNAENPTITTTSDQANQKTASQGETETRRNELAQIASEQETSQLAAHQPSLKGQLQDGQSPHEQLSDEQSLSATIQRQSFSYQPPPIARAETSPPGDISPQHHLSREVSGSDTRQNSEIQNESQRQDSTDLTPSLGQPVPSHQQDGPSISPSQTSSTDGTGHTLQTAGSLPQAQSASLSLESIPQEPSHIPQTPQQKSHANNANQVLEPEIQKQATGQSALPNNTVPPSAQPASVPNQTSNLVNGIPSDNPASIASPELSTQSPGSIQSSASESVPSLMAQVQNNDAHQTPLSQKVPPTSEGDTAAPFHHQVQPNETRATQASANAVQPTDQRPVQAASESVSHQIGTHQSEAPTQSPTQPLNQTIQKQATPHPKELPLSTDQGASQPQDSSQPQEQPGETEALPRLSLKDQLPQDRTATPTSTSERHSPQPQTAERQTSDSQQQSQQLIETPEAQQPTHSSSPSLTLAAGSLQPSEASPIAPQSPSADPVVQQQRKDEADAVSSDSKQHNPNQTHHPLDHDSHKPDASTDQPVAQRNPLSPLDPTQSLQETIRRQTIPYHLYHQTSAQPPSQRQGLPNESLVDLTSADLTSSPHVSTDLHPTGQTAQHQSPLEPSDQALSTSTQPNHPQSLTPADQQTLSATSPQAKPSPQAETEPHINRVERVEADQTTQNSEQAYIPDSSSFVPLPTPSEKMSTGPRQDANPDDDPAQSLRATIQRQTTSYQPPTPSTPPASQSNVSHPNTENRAPSGVPTPSKQASEQSTETLHRPSQSASFTPAQSPSNVQATSANPLSPGSGEATSQSPDNIPQSSAPAASLAIDKAIPANPAETDPSFSDSTDPTNPRRQASSQPVSGATTVQPSDLNQDDLSQSNLSQSNLSQSNLSPPHSDQAPTSQPQPLSAQNVVQHPAQSTETPESHSLPQPESRLGQQHQQNQSSSGNLAQSSAAKTDQFRESHSTPQKEQEISTDPSPAIPNSSSEDNSPTNRPAPIHARPVTSTDDINRYFNPEVSSISSADSDGPEQRASHSSSYNTYSSFGPTEQPSQRHTAPDETLSQAQTTQENVTAPNRLNSNPSSPAQVDSSSSHPPSATKAAYPSRQEPKSTPNPAHGDTSHARPQSNTTAQASASTHTPSTEPSIEANRLAARASIDQNHQTSPPTSSNPTQPNQNLPKAIASDQSLETIFRTVDHPEADHSSASKPTQKTQSPASQGSPNPAAATASPETGANHLPRVPQVLKKLNVLKPLATSAKYKTPLQAKRITPPGHDRPTENDNPTPSTTHPLASSPDTIQGSGGHAASTHPPIPSQHPTDTPQGPQTWSSLADLVSQTISQGSSAFNATIQSGVGNSSDPTSSVPDISRQSDIPSNWSSLADLIGQTTTPGSTSEHTSTSNHTSSQPSPIPPHSNTPSGTSASNPTPSPTTTPPNDNSSPGQQAHQSPTPPSAKASPNPSKSSTPKTTATSVSSHSQTKSLNQNASVTSRAGQTLIQRTPDEGWVQRDSEDEGQAQAEDPGETAKYLEMLAQEMYSQIKQRLAIEQERYGSAHFRRW